MLTLSNDDRKQLREAIESAYPKPSDLEIFVDEQLNTNLASISTAGAHRTVIFDLIKWAIAKGYIEDLILAFARDTDNRTDIQQFCGRVLRQRLVLNVSESLIGGLDLGLSRDTCNFMPRKLESIANCWFQTKPLLVGKALVHCGARQLTKRVRLG